MDGSLTLPDLDRLFFLCSASSRTSAGRTSAGSAELRYDRDDLVIFDFVCVVYLDSRNGTTKIQSDEFYVKLTCECVAQQCPSSAHHTCPKTSQFP